MLATPVAAPPSGSGFLHEIKYDGFRLRAARSGGGPVLVYRGGGTVTTLYPEIARAVMALPAEEVVLDGELVVFGADGRPRFELLQTRAQQRRPDRIRAGMAKLPAVFCAFDLLGIDGVDWRARPLIERKARLEELLAGQQAIRFVEHVTADGPAFFAAATRMGLEGTVSKRASSQYRGGRSAEWLKCCAHRTGRFAVVGLDPDHSAVHVAGMDGDTLRYAGRIEWGVSRNKLAGADQVRASLARPSPPCADAPPTRNLCWLEPALACEVRFKQWLPGGRLRDAVLLGFADSAEVHTLAGPDSECATSGATRRFGV